MNRSEFLDVAVLNALGNAFNEGHGVVYDTEGQYLVWRTAEQKQAVLNFVSSLERTEEKE